MEIDFLLPGAVLCSTPHSLSQELTDLSVRCGMPQSFFPRTQALGITTVAKLAYSVSTDKELLGEVMGTTTDGVTQQCVGVKFLL